MSIVYNVYDIAFLLFCFDQVFDLNFFCQDHIRIILSFNILFGKFSSLSKKDRNTVKELIVNNVNTFQTKIDNIQDRNDELEAKVEDSKLKRPKG